MGDIFDISNTGDVKKVQLLICNIGIPRILAEVKTTRQTEFEQLTIECSKTLKLFLLLYIYQFIIGKSCWIGNKHLIYQYSLLKRRFLQEGSFYKSKVIFFRIQQWKTVNDFVQWKN